MSERKKESVPSEWVWELREAMGELKEPIKNETLAELCHCSENKIYKMFHLVEEEQVFEEEDEEGDIVIKTKPMRFERGMPVEDYERIVLAVNPLREAEGLKTVSCYDSPERRDVLDTARASLDQLIKLLSDDARGMHDLEAYAWDLYRRRYPRRPEFFDYHAPNLPLPHNDGTRADVWETSAEHWTEEEREYRIQAYEEAKAAAEAKVEQHVEVERRHYEAEAAADSIYMNSLNGEPAMPWERMDQYRRIIKYVQWAVSDLHRWYLACPPDEEHERDLRRIALEWEREMLDEELRREDVLYDIASSPL